MTKSETSGQTSAGGALAAGRYSTPHHIPFGDLVFYCQSNLFVPLDRGAAKSTTASAGPGTRFHIANDYFLLTDVDTRYGQRARP